MDGVVAALEEQVAMYRRLAKLAELQHEHVQQQRTEELLEVLSKRQEILDELPRLENVIAGVRKEWSSYLKALEAKDRARALAAMAEAQQLLGQITAADRRDALVLQQRKLNVGNEIKAARSAHQVNRNYATAAYGRSTATVDVKDA
jgi:hypothetical protein